MAKQKLEHGAKSAAAREILERDPNARVSDIVAELASRGISVNPQLIYALKSRQRTGKPLGRRGRKPRDEHMEGFLAVLDLARKIGVANLRSIVERLPQ